MSFQKNVKSHVFWKSEEKKTKNTYSRTLPCVINLLVSFDLGTQRRGYYPHSGLVIWVRWIKLNVSCVRTLKWRIVSCRIVIILLHLVRFSRNCDRNSQKISVVSMKTGLNGDYKQLMTEISYPRGRCILYAELWRRVCITQRDTSIMNCMLKMRLHLACYKFNVHEAIICCLVDDMLISLNADCGCYFPLTRCVRHCFDIWHETRTNAANGRGIW